MKFIVIFLFVFIQPKPRYFFVSYLGQSQSGTFWSSCQVIKQYGGLPNKPQLINNLKQIYPELKFHDSSFHIMGIYEFKTKAECDTFFKYYWQNKKQ